MKIVKFIVFICFVQDVRSSAGRYCAICQNHTLCKYPVEGPSPACVDYDRSALLTNKDSDDIVNRINERRHQVAMGLLIPFPEAANMKKVRWSSKLARFAQRWVDQCDTSLRPDRQDECRDLVSMEVGQSIATVLGASPGIAVKSFVDTWFMLNMHFKGSVAYYNQSKDSKSNYFTQLIWADSLFVGCGRAKFFVDGTRKEVERLVCNFAPKGNVHGKPVYTIGYPGTQCPTQMIRDAEFTSLCLQKPATITKVSTTSSLLRILNLANNSLKQELDPNILKQANLNSTEINNRRNQKARQIYNNTYGAVKRDSFHIHQNPMRNRDMHEEQQYGQRQFTPERGHSRMYHGHQPNKEAVFNLDMTHLRTENDFNRMDYSTASFYSTQGIMDVRKNFGVDMDMNGRKIFGGSMDSRKYHEDSSKSRKFNGGSVDGRKHYVNNGCTRMSHEIRNWFPKPPCEESPCTRGQSHCQQPSPCQHTTCARIENLCPCNDRSTPVHNCNQKCQPSTMSPPFTSYCPYRKIGGGEIEKPTPIQYDNYDLFHNLEVKSSDDDSSRNVWRVENSNPDQLDKIKHRRKSDPYKQVTILLNESQKEIRKLSASYRSSDYSKRKKRDLEEQTFKPFWQMDEYNQKRPYDLKSIRYTTLSNRKLKKNRRIETTLTLPTSTETITIKPKDRSSMVVKSGQITEKYLSFDELMHLRKLSSTQIVQSSDFRRKASTVEEPKPSMTQNPPFIRMKQCTRLLTCTWTAAALFNGSGPGGAWGEGGGQGPGGGRGWNRGGSRTPPGYVEGCTRTSTCTRDYMDRNKQAASEGPDGATLEDEDYCERRSLNIRRRDSDEKRVPALIIGHQETFTDHSSLAIDIDETKLDTDSSDLETSTKSEFDCFCNKDNTRMKKRDISMVKQLLNTRFNNVRGRKKGHKHLPCSGDCTTYSSRSKNSTILYQCPCNGIKSLHNMFYRSISVNYYAAWMLYHIFIIRTFDG